MKSQFLSKKILSIIVSVVVVGGLALFAQNTLEHNSSTKSIEVSSSINKYTLDELTEQSKYIVVGKVESITPTQPITYDDLSITLVYTDVLINVERDLSGKLKDKQISIRTIGGESENLKVKADEEPQFSIGEKVLLFVSDKESNQILGDHYYVAGALQGKYKLANGKAYGVEYRDGIDEVEFTSKVEKMKTSKTNSTP